MRAERAARAMQLAMVPTAIALAVWLMPLSRVYGQRDRIPRDRIPARASATTAELPTVVVPPDSTPKKKPERRVYLLMSTYHFRARHEGVRAHPALAVAWRGLYAGAFRNSFDQWSVTAGYEDDMLAWQLGALRTEFGYRAGLLTGYDDWQHPLGNRPVIPFAQLRLNAMTRRIGVELAYGGIVATSNAYIRF